MPQELQSLDNEAHRTEPDNAVYQYVRARGLTLLRHRLNDACHARFCLGGRRSGSQGRYPGVIEEALLAANDNKPLYLASLLGGATEQVVDAIEGKPIRDEFCPPTPLQVFYNAPPVSESDEGTREDRVIDRTGVWTKFVQTGRQKLAAANGLTLEENDELLHTPVIDRAIELVLIGLSRLRPALLGQN